MLSYELNNSTESYLKKKLLSLSLAPPSWREQSRRYLNYSEFAHAYSGRNDNVKFCNVLVQLQSSTEYHFTGTIALIRVTKHERKPMKPRSTFTLSTKSLKKHDFSVCTKKN